MYKNLYIKPQMKPLKEYIIKSSHFGDYINSFDLDQRNSGGSPLKFTSINNHNNLYYLKLLYFQNPINHNEFLPESIMFNEIFLNHK